MYKSLPRNQKGMTLIVGLILLLLTSLLVITGARVILKEVTFSKNTQDRELSFQAAEAALSEAASNLDVYRFSFPSAGLVETSISDVFVRGTKEYWLNTYQWFTSTGEVDSSKSIEVSGSFAGLASKPRFVVERLPSVTDGCSIGVPKERYRITAIAFGRQVANKSIDQTKTILQAEYSYCPDA